MSPTILLVHGAFAESSSWNRVIAQLEAAGLPAIGVANPLRSVAGDAAAVSDVVRTIEGPVVLVGHSYGGVVVTNVDPDAGDIAAVVYVAAFAPAPGESAFELAAKFPGSTLGEAVEPVPLAGGETDLYITRSKFHQQFCHDAPEAEAALMAATQRPVTQEALQGPSGAHALWDGVPSYYVIAEGDRNIPAEAQRFCADRAQVRNRIEIAGASHAIAVSQPTVVADLVMEAAALPIGA
jgi:pimeloyl-ACP methyl ester carboxylesterase